MVVSATKFMKKDIVNLEESIGYLSSRASRVMGKYLSSQFKTTGFEMPIEHWAILVVLWKEDGRTQKQISDHVFKDKGTITRGISLLEVNNLVVRVPDQEDKRIKRIYLTHKGKTMFTKLSPHVKCLKEEVLKDISEDDLKVCKQVLRKIYNNLIGKL